MNSLRRLRKPAKGRVICTDGELRSKSQNMFLCSRSNKVSYEGRRQQFHKRTYETTQEITKRQMLKNPKSIRQLLQKLWQKCTAGVKITGEEPPGICQCPLETPRASITTLPKLSIISFFFAPPKELNLKENIAWLWFEMLVKPVRLLEIIQGFVMF